MQFSMKESEIYQKELYKCESLSEFFNLRPFLDVTSLDHDKNIQNWKYLMDKYKLKDFYVLLNERI